MINFLIFKGTTWKNCGQSAGQAEALQADQQFQRMLTSDYSKEFGNNQQILQDLTGNLGKIFNAGPGQQGFTPEELASMNAQQINAAAAANKNVQQAIGEAGARSTSTPGVESGVIQAERARAATDVENNLANQEANITQKNYATGRNNYWSATEGLMKAPSALESPTNQFSGDVINAGKATSDQANQNAAANNSWMGLVSGLAGDATSFFKPK